MFINIKKRKQIKNKIYKNLSNQQTSFEENSLRTRKKIKNSKVSKTDPDPNHKNRWKAAKRLKNR